MSFLNFPSPTPVFPSLPPLAWPVNKKPSFTSLDHRSVNGKEFQTYTQAYPNWDFELQYGDASWLREQTQNQSLYTENSPHVELESISQLFLSCYGNYGEFYYDDPDDDSRFEEFIANGDGATTRFRVVRGWGLASSNLARLEPVGGVNLTQPITLFINGVQQPSGAFAITNDPTGSFLNLITAPPIGQPITMTFHFYYRCRWLLPMQQYDQFMYNLWQLGKAQFRSVKP